MVGSSYYICDSCDAEMFRFIGTIFGVKDACQFS